MEEKKFEMDVALLELVRFCHEYDVAVTIYNRNDFIRLEFEAPGPYNQKWVYNVPWYMIDNAFLPAQLSLFRNVTTKALIALGIIDEPYPIFLYDEWSDPNRPSKYRKDEKHETD